MQGAASGQVLPAMLSSAGGASQQQQTTTSNDGLHVESSFEHQHAAASVNAHGTVVEEELPVSDAETDLSSVGIRHSAQGEISPWA